MKWINSLKKLADVGGGGQNMDLNQNCRKFHEMDKSSTKFFFIVWLIGGWGGFKFKFKMALRSNKQGHEQTFSLIKLFLLN